MCVLAWNDAGLRDVLALGPAQTQAISKQRNGGTAPAAPLLHRSRSPLRRPARPLFPIY